MGQDKEEYQVGGFSFTDQHMAEQAQKEIEGIKYIKSKTDMENPDMVLEIYHKILDEKLFETPVGYCFLKELQDYLTTIPFVRSGEVNTIPVAKIPKSEAPLIAGKRRGRKKQKPETEKKIGLIEKNVNYKTRYRTLVTLTIAMLITIVAMFAVTMTSNSPNILNYENEIINRYENWEQELNQREQELNQREKDLNDQNE